LIDYDALLLAIALLYAIIAIVIVIIIYINKILYKTSSDRYVSGLLVRIGAAIIDITILRLIIEVLLIIANPTQGSPILFLFVYFPLNPIYFPFMIIGTCLSSYLFFYIPLFGGSFFSLPSLLIAIISFLYFFVCDAFLGGRTIGRFIMRVKSIHESKTRVLHVEEACITAVGKTFLLLDLSLGFMVAICYSKNPGLRQIRLSQRVAGAVTMSTSFDPQSAEEISDPFLKDDSTGGELW